MNHYEMIGQAQLMAAEGRIQVARAVFAALRRFVARATATLTRQARIADLH